MRLRFTPQAVADLAKIAEYLRERSPQASLSVRAAIYGTLERLLIFPTLGRRQKTEGVQKLVTPRYGYLVYYTLDAVPGEIVVLSVKHAAQQREHQDD